MPYPESLAVNLFLCADSCQQKESVRSIVTSNLVLGPNMHCIHLKLGTSQIPCVDLRDHSLQILKDQRHIWLSKSRKMDSCEERKIWTLRVQILQVHLSNNVQNFSPTQIRMMKMPKLMPLGRLDYANTYKTRQFLNKNCEFETQAQQPKFCRDSVLSCLGNS